MRSSEEARRKRRALRAMEMKREVDELEKEETV